MTDPTNKWDEAEEMELRYGFEDEETDRYYDKEIEEENSCSECND